MRTMSGSPCLHYDCSNRNSFGYCKTAVCINEHYQREQWGLPSTTNKSESVVIKRQTNADRIRAMTDEELATIIFYGNPCIEKSFMTETELLVWLKQEAAK